VFSAAHALIGREQELNDKCRGAIGSESAIDAICAARDQAITDLAKRNVCWGPDDAIEADKHWVLCKAPPGSLSAHAVVVTNGDATMPPEQIPDPGGMIQANCPGGVTEATLMPFMQAPDPYAFKGKCYATSLNALGQSQWINESTIILIPTLPIPNTTPIVIGQAQGHLQLGARAVIAGIDPVPYQSALGAQVTPPSFRVVRYINQSSTP